MEAPPCFYDRYGAKCKGASGIEISHRALRTDVSSAAFAATTRSWLALWFGVVVVVDVVVVAVAKSVRGGDILLPQPSPCDVTRPRPLTPVLRQAPHGGKTAVRPSSPAAARATKTAAYAYKARNTRPCSTSAVRGAGGYRSLIGP